MRKQLNALEGDSSEEARKRKQQLKAELADAEQEQKDTLYDRSVEDSISALDKMVTDAEDMATQYLKDSEKVFVDALAYVNSHTYQVSQNLERFSQKLGFEISDNITNAWKDAGKAVDSYESILTGNIPSITSQIQLITTAWQNACDAAEKASKAIVNATEGEYVEHTTEGADAKVLSDIEWYIQKNGVAPKNKPSSYSPLNQYIYEKTGKVIAEDKQAGLAKILGITGLSKDTSAAERAKILKALKAAGFSNGGVINARSVGEDGFALVRHEEAILTKPEWQSLRDLTDVLSNINHPTFNPYVPDFQTRNIQSPVYNIDNSITVEGIATDKIVKDMENVATKQAEKVVSKINNMTYAKGVRR